MSRRRVALGRDTDQTGPRRVFPVGRFRLIEQRVSVSDLPDLSVMPSGCRTLTGSLCCGVGLSTKILLIHARHFFFVPFASRLRRAARMEERRPDTGMCAR